MASIKFQVQSTSSKSAPIYIRFSFARGKAPKQKTGLLIDFREWSTNTGFPKQSNPENKNLITKLKSLESFVLENYNNDYSSGTVIDSAWLKNVIDNFNHRPIEDDLSYLSAYAKYYYENLPQGTSKSTISKYKNIFLKIEAFEDFKQKKYLLKEVDKIFKNDFISFLQSSEVKNPNPLNENSANRAIAFVKTIVRNAQSNGKEVSFQINELKAPKIKVPKVILSFKEIEQIKNTPFEKRELEIAKDWLIIGCFVGQRIGDLLRLDKSMIESIKGYNFISLTQQKTKKFVQIPIHKEVDLILKKWKGNFPDTYSMNLQSNAALLNRYIKDVCRIAGINKITEGNLKNESGKTETGFFKKYKLITTHSFRRSFCTNFYSERDYPTPLLMAISGHSTEQMFLTYIGKKPIDYALQLAEIWKNNK